MSDAVVAVVGLGYVGLPLRKWDEVPAADALVVAVAHRSYISAPLERLRSKIAPQGCFIDVKSRFDAQALKSAGITVWRL